MMAKEKKIIVRLFKTPAGNEPVRDWLKNSTQETKKGNWRRHKSS
jgi:hypothetical protein